MSKPREFWVKPGEHSEGFPWHPEQNSWNDGFYSCVSENQFDNGIKVIECSDYEDLKAKHERVLQMLEIATKALKQIAGPRKKDGSYFYSIPEIQKMGDDGADTDNARYALEKIDKIESLK